MLLNLRDVLASDKLATDFDYAVDLSGEELYGERPFREPVQAKGRLADKAGVFRLTAMWRRPLKLVAPVAARLSVWSRSWILR